MKHTAVILLGRGGYSGAPLTQMQAMVDAVAATAKYGAVQSAFIDQGTPSLPDALNACCGLDIQRVWVVPVYVPTDRSVEGWLDKVMRRWLHHRQPVPFSITLLEGIGDAPEMGAAVVQLLDRSVQRDNIALSASGVRPNSPGWSVIPPAAHHVLVCRGPRCNTAGAGETAAQLSRKLREEQLGDDAVLVAQTGCLFPCNLGPMMVVYPEGVWYCGLNEAAIDQIVEQHFIGGQIVEAHARYPMDEAQQRPEPWEKTL